MSVWNFLEMVSLTEDSYVGEELPPLQLYKATGSQSGLQSPIWVLGGTPGSGRDETMLIQLFQKAVQAGVFKVAPDVYMTPVAFPLAPDSAFYSILVSTLERWYQVIRPKCIVSFSHGHDSLRSWNMPTDMLSRLHEICERPLYNLGAEPEFFKEEDHSLLPFDSIDNCLFQWIKEDPEVCWLDFCLARNRKSFDEIREIDWKTKVGPSLRWLVDDLRFNPVKEPPPVQHTIIPVMELPPEFANL